MNSLRQKVPTYSEKNSLPVGYYFHPKYREFRFNLFQDGPNYVGHELMVPNILDYRVLEIMDDQYILVRVEGNKCIMISNICRHQQARLIDPKNRPGTDHRSGNLKLLNQTGGILCPIHKWSYTLDGKLRHAPKFEPSPNLCLPVIVLKSWNGMLFHTDRNMSNDLKELGHSKYFDPQLVNMSNYIYVGSDEPISIIFLGKDLLRYIWIFIILLLIIHVHLLKLLIAMILNGNLRRIITYKLQGGVLHLSRH
jgi:nitrite reductase/ring-hydroxylating ferredoxin subunit